MVQPICLNYATVAEWLPLVVVNCPCRSAVVPVEVAENQSVNPFSPEGGKKQAFSVRFVIGQAQNGYACFVSVFVKTGG